MLKEGGDRTRKQGRILWSSQNANAVSQNAGAVVAKWRWWWVLFNGYKRKGRTVRQVRHRGGHVRGCESEFHARKARGVSGEGNGE